MEWIKNKMDKKFQINFWYVIIAILGILMVQNLYKEYTKVEPIPYSRFHTLLEQDKIAEIAITENHIYGTLKDKGSDGLKNFVTTRVESELADKLDKHNVTYTCSRGSIHPRTSLTSVTAAYCPTCCANC